MIFLLSQALFLVGSLLVCGALCATVVDVEPNDNRAQAQVLNFEDFDLTANPKIFASTTVPHVTIQGTGDDTLDFFVFETTGTPLATFDVDDPTSFDTEIFLWDAAGTLLASNDDNEDGQQAELDVNSLIRRTLPAGTYVLAVGRFNSAGANNFVVTGNTPQAGNSYTLHVSINPIPFLYRNIDASVDDAVRGENCFCINNDDSFTVNAVDGDCAGATGSARVKFRVPFSWQREDEDFEENEAPTRCGLQLRLRINDKTVARTEEQPEAGALYPETGEATQDFRVKLARGKKHCVAVEHRDMPSCDVYKSTDSSDSSAWEATPFGKCTRGKKKRAIESSSSSGETRDAQSIRESPRFVCAARSVVDVRILDSSSSGSSSD
jgi:hypothetical protein